jgi:hypothetical protein
MGSGRDHLEGSYKMVSSVDFWRPVVGTIALQPLALAWAAYSEVPYLETLGIFTVLSTIYLIPVYAIYQAHAQ